MEEILVKLGAFLTTLHADESGLTITNMEKSEWNKWISHMLMNDVQITDTKKSVRCIQPEHSMNYPGKTSIL